MHGPPFTRTKWRTCLSWRERTRSALKNWLSRDRTAGRGPRCGICRRRTQRRRWGLVNRTRSSLRHDHSRRRSKRSAWFDRRRRLHLRHIVAMRRGRRWREWSASGWRCRRSGSRRTYDNRRRRIRRSSGTRGRQTRSRWSRRHFGRNHDNRGRPVSCGHGSGRHHSGRRRGSFARRFRRYSFRRDRSGEGSFCLRLDWRRRSGCFNGGARGRIFCGDLLLRDGAQHVARPRNMREVDLGLKFVFAVAAASRGPRRARRRFRAAQEMLSHQFRFVIFQ